MDRDLCANCGHWREEHYNASGAFIGDRWYNCVEYLGTVPTAEQRAKKGEDLAVTQAERAEFRGITQ